MDSALDQRLLNEINALLPDALVSDARSAVRELRRLGAPPESRDGGRARRAQLEGLFRRIQGSVSRRRRRLAERPEVSFDEALPISSKKDEIISAVQKHPVVIVSGETGSGKTTQIPKFCLAAGRGIDGKIGCTQPRRIAATTVARRVAEELGENLGKSVGYKIRFKDRSDPDGYIKIMTDGILLAEAQSDRLLGEYDTLIVDEAHERSLNIDFILGILKGLLKKRNDLKLIITSATIDTQKFSAAFDHAPVIEVSGRMYPVRVDYVCADGKEGQDGEQTHVDAAVDAVEGLCRKSPFGDILVFMPTEQDIRETCDLIEGRGYPGVKVLPLFARLSGVEQSRVFTRTAGRKIIVSTNVAETSLTIPGIRYVVDTGLARIPRYSPRTRTTSLPVVPISRSSADQRMGRCGRVENGVCIRLYSEADYQGRPLYTPPEIVRSNLAEVILRMTALKLGDVSRFAFIDQPAVKSIKDGYDLLVELGGIVRREPARKGGGAGYRLTAVGRLMARLPIDPRLSRMLIESRKEGCVESVAVIAAALSLQDPRERPIEKAAAADQAHAEFKDPASDFVTLLNIWNRYHEALAASTGTNQMKGYCRARFLSFMRMREWRDIHAQIGAVLKEAEFGVKKKTSSADPPRKPEEDVSGDIHGAVHRSILSGLLSNIAVKKGKNLFSATKGREVMIFPGSGLFNRAGAWIVAAEMVETSRLFARTAATIDPRWLEALGGTLCRSTTFDPHWERNRGEVVATEQVSLFGLVIVAGRTVSYSAIDPEAAADIFIRSALVEEDVRRPLPFMMHNRKQIETIKTLENKVRRREFMVGDEELVAFYKQRLDGCCDMRTLARRIRTHGDRFLRLEREDLLRCAPDENELALYPDRVDLGVDRFECVYQFDPGSPEDGVTVRIPQSAAPAVPAEAVDWLVPGLLKEKIFALIKGLAKGYRKQLVPVADTVAVICDEMPRAGGALISVLSEFIYRRFGVDIPAAAWPEESLPDHLRFRVTITDPEGRQLSADRGRAGLRRSSGAAVGSPVLDQTRAQWERSDIRDWDFGELPEIVRIEGRESSAWGLYPGLAAASDGQGVDLKLFNQLEAASASHRRGVAVLYTRYFAKDLKFLKKRLCLPVAMRPAAAGFGGVASVEAALYRRVVSVLFERNIRSRDSFEVHAAAVAPRILEIGAQWLNGAVAVLGGQYAAHGALEGLARADRFNQGIRQYLEERSADLTRLVPKNFLELYALERFAHLARYMQSTVVRAERGVVDLEKDRAKDLQVAVFSNDLSRMIQGLTPAASAAKREAVEEFHWMLEEYKVSVFAQELGTAVPVSEKRLKRRVGEIERMI